MQRAERLQRPRRLQRLRVSPAKQAPGQLRSVAAPSLFVVLARVGALSASIGEMLETNRARRRRPRSSPVTSPPDPDLSALFREIPDPNEVRRLSSEAPRLAAVGASPARDTVRKRRVAALTASATWLLTHLAVYGVRTDLHGLPVLYVAAQILLPFAVALASLFAALAYGKLGLGAKIGLISGLALLGPLAFCLVAFGAPLPTASAPGDSSALGILVCFDITVAWTAVPLLAATLTLRGAFATGARWRSALIGAAVGLFAGATMNLHCPNVAPLHMLAGHGLPVIVATLLGSFVLGYRARA